jgi:4-amino-4-deoxy-L-arabinose transferase-like glycosyltransferase
MGSGGKKELSGRGFFLLLALYLACHLMLRVLATGNAELDEAEQIVWGQHLSLGYGAELPLYTWLQAIFFHLLGINIFAVALLRSLLLFLLYLFTYLGALEATENKSCALAAAASLLLIPLISWEAQRILTHMLLASALAAASIFFFLRLLKTGKVHYYISFGLFAGLGMLTKYNFGIFLTALTIAACANPVMRNSLTNRRILAAIMAFILITYFPFSWIMGHPQIAMAKAGKLHSAAAAGLLDGYLAGFGDLLKGVAGFHLFLVPVILSIFIKAPFIRESAARSRELHNLLGRTVLTAIGICVIMILFFHVTHLKSRWLLPLLLPVPIYIISLVQAKLGPRQLRMLLACSGVAALIVLTALPARVFLARHTGTYSRMNIPYDLFAGELRKSGFTGGVIVAESNLLGGNLKLRFPESEVVVPLLEKPRFPGTVPLLLVWDATGKEGAPERLAAIAESLSAASAREVRYKEAPALYMPERKERLGFIILFPASPSRMTAWERAAAMGIAPQPSATRFLQS